MQWGWKSGRFYLEELSQPTTMDCVKDGTSTAWSMYEFRMMVMMMMYFQFSITNTTDMERSQLHGTPEG